MKYAKNDIVLEPGWISDAFELSEPELYKLVTMVTRDDENPNTYTVPVGRWDPQTSVYEYKYEEIHQNALLFPFVSISKKEPRKISGKKIRLHIVPCAPTLFYQQGNHNSCILSSLSSALHYMCDEYAPKYIFKPMQRSLLEMHNKGRMHLFRDVLMGHNRKKTIKKLLYWIMAYIHAIWYIVESVYLSKLVF